MEPTERQIESCAEYLSIYHIWGSDFNEKTSKGSEPIYILDGMRQRKHEEMCREFGISHRKTKKITDNLDGLGIDGYEEADDETIRKEAIILAEALLKEKKREDAEAKANTVLDKLGAAFYDKRRKQGKRKMDFKNMKGRKKND